MATSLGALAVTVGAKIDGFERAMGTVSQRINAVDREASKAFSGFEKLGDRLTAVGTGLTAAISLPLAAAAGAATKFAADFELGMRQVTSLLGGVTQQEFQNLSARTLELARAMGIDAVKATNALYEAISAGVPKDNAVEFIGVASKAAIAGLTDTAVAVDSLTTLIAAYNLSFEDAGKVSDALFQAVNVGKFTFEELAKSIGPAASQAKNLGISYEELLAATSTLSITSGGVSIAVTQIESAMRALLQPTKEMQAAFKQIGVESGSAAVATFGFEGTLEKLRQSTGGSSEAFNALFGRIEGYNAAIGLTGDRSATAARDLETLRNSTGAADKAFEEINKTTSRQFERLTNELKATAIELGTALLPAVNSLLTAARPLVDVLASVVSWFTKLPSPIQATLIGIGALSAAIGPIVLLGGQAVTVFGQMSSSLTALRGFVEQAGGSVNLLRGAIGSLVLAAGAAGTALLVFDSLKQVSEDGKEAATNISQIASAVSGTVTQTSAWRTFLEIGGAGLQILKVEAGNAAQAITALDSLGRQFSQIDWWEKLRQALAGPGLGSLIEFAEQIKNLSAQFKSLLGIYPEMDKAISGQVARLQAAAKAQGGLSDSALALYASTKGLPGTISAADKALASASKTTAAASKSSNAFREAVEKEKKVLQESQEKTRIHQQAMRELGLETEKTGKSFLKFTDTQPLLVAEVKRAQQEYDRSVKELVRLKQALADGTVGTIEFADSLGIVQGAAVEADTDLSKLPQVTFPGYISGLDQVIAANSAAGEAFKALGITSSTELQRTADRNKEAYDAIFADADASLRDVNLAWVKYQESAIEAAKAAGRDVPKEQQAALDKMKDQLGIATREQKTQWGQFGEQVSTIITNTAQDITKALFSGDLSWAEKGKEALKSLGQAVVSSFIEPATKAIGDFIGGVLADLLGGKGFGGVKDALGGLGDALGGLFGGGGQTAGQVGGAAGGVAGAAGGAGQAAGGAGAAASGLVGVLGAVGAIGAAIGSIGSFIQGFQIEKGLDAIEKEVRYTQIYTKEILEKGVNEFQAKLPQIADLSRQFVDHHAWRIHDVWDRLGEIKDIVLFDVTPLLGEIRDAIRTPQVPPQQLQFSGTGGGNTINIYNPSFSDQASVDRVFSEIRRNL